MNASYEWLRTLVPADLSPEAMRDIITARCCPVDELVRLRADLADVVIGLVVEAKPHPDSDHLWVTRVDAGRDELLDVVCGAPNVRAGAKYPFAPAGATLPGGLKLEKRKIRGAVSNGMLCSARELALGTDHEGILEVDTAAAPGTPFLAAVPVGDARLVVDVTPNRSDLLSHVGIARELSAATGTRVAIPPVPGAADGAVAPPPVRAPREATAGDVGVILADAAGCPRYMGVVLRGVTVADSPDWLAQRLIAVGSRPINNVVDVTNYLLHELGQPMHAFDARRLAGPAVVIRRARAGESITTLDGTVRTLNESMTVIADAERAQAVAGVMGGADSEVGPGTTDIFLEVAHFEPRGVRRTRRALGLSTDASYRFERTVDPELPPHALARAVEMLLAVAGGRVDGVPVDLYPAPRARLTVHLRDARVASVLGEPVPRPEIEALLGAVGFGGTPAADGLDIVVPSWRPDVIAEVDLVEEVARLHGYDAFSSELRPFRIGTVPDSPVEVAGRRVRDRLVALGLLEARPMPFVVGAAEGFVRVRNPLAENEAYLRRELLDTLARRAEYNLSHMQRDVRLFEVGPAWTPSGGELPLEELRAAILVMGHRRPPHWSEAETPDVDEWDAKGLAEELVRSAFPAAATAVVPASSDDPGALWDVVVDDAPVGAVRRVPLDAPVWAAPAFGVEVTLMVVPSVRVAAPGTTRYESAEGERAPGVPVHRYVPLPTTPAAEFDLALLVPDDLPAATVERVIRSSAGDLLERVVLFDEYRGAGVPTGHRSLAWRLTLRHPERTLRDKEIAGRREKLLRTLEGELGVRQRTS